MLNEKPKLKLYNTLTREIEPFRPLKKIVTLYSCGPTVYNEVHIGNHRTFLTTDFLKRTLGFLNYRVKHVMNITDVGHLTDDADAGQDKLEIGARRERKTVYEIAQQYTALFKKDLKTLNIQPPDVWTPATKFIPEQIALVKKLEQGGFTYRTGDGIYFDTSKFANYGALQNLRRVRLRVAARVPRGEKKHETDFALWKFSPKDAKRQMEWKSPWGIGFPGWHIECSAMSMDQLGPTIDIHVGGTDLIPVHHTNEIAQSEAATGKKFVRFWVHSAFVLENYEKLAKSTGHFRTLRSLAELGFSPLDFRYLALQTHYHKELHFSIEAIQAAKNARNQLAHITSLTRASKPDEITINKFRAALCNDLNLPAALATVWDCTKTKCIRDDAVRTATLLACDAVLGLKLGMRQTHASVPNNVKKLLKLRENARKQKNWKISDELRDEIIALGWQIKDSPQGQRVEPVL